MYHKKESSDKVATKGKRPDVPVLSTDKYSNRTYLKFGEIIEEDPITYYIKGARVPDSDTFDVIKYWNGYYDKALATMAIEFLSIPASSSNVERFFSTARTLDRFNRQAMNSESKSELILCKGWWKLYIQLNRKQ